MPRSSPLLVLSLLAGCGISQPAVPMQQFVNGELGAVVDFARHEATAGPVENQALVLNVLAQCELLSGDVNAAWQHFGVAARLMRNWGATSGSEEFAAVVGSESSKAYKGDPYEQAMNAFYLGLCYLWRGEPDNARASFKRGILADGESGDEQYQADFTLLFWLAGRMSLLMGLPGDADDLFAEARTAHEFALQHGSRGELPNAVLDSPKAGNLLLLVECGLGPEKYADGQEQELARFRPSSHPAARAQVFLDDRAAGHTQILTDVDYQARTRGGTEMEGIRKGKAVLKSTLRAAGVGALVWAANDDSHAGARDKWLVGMGLLLASALTQSAADVRHWPTLPSTVQVLALDVVPGEHALRIEFLDQAGNVLADLTQNWSVQVPAGSESWYIFRSLPGLDRFPRSIS